MLQNILKNNSKNILTKKWREESNPTQKEQEKKRFVLFREEKEKEPILLTLYLCVICIIIIIVQQIKGISVGMNMGLTFARIPMRISSFSLIISPALPSLSLSQASSLSLLAARCWHHFVFLQKRRTSVHDSSPTLICQLLRFYLLKIFMASFICSYFCIFLNF